ncbi:MAG: ABC transporter ATP-binding protein [Alkalispirochaeta sp.]
MTDTPVLMRELNLAYPGGPTVLAAHALSIRSGALTSLVGPNGGGKTTLLRCMAGFLPPTRGSVELSGTAVYGRGALSRRRRARILSVVLTDRVAPAYLRVEDLVALGRIPYRSVFGSTDARNDAAVYHAMEQTGVTHLAGRSVGRLSDGERQRVMIARALAQEPRILLLDEPAAHLDPPHQTALFQLLHRLVSEGIVTSAVVATHHLHLALHFSHELVLVGGGAIRTGTPNDLLDTGDLEQAFLHGRDVREALTLDRNRGWFVPNTPGGS